MATQTFRAGVVLVVSRSDGHVMVFERRDVPGAWQFPQGGLDAGEEPLDAAWRELAEETSLTPTEVELVREGDDWIAYEVLPERRRGIGRGQVQRWFYFRAVTEDVQPTVDQREFVAWQWQTMEWVLNHVPDFRQQPYRRGLSALDRTVGRKDLSGSQPVPARDR